jgi:hypothetical protein
MVYPRAPDHLVQPLHVVHEAHANVNTSNQRMHMTSQGVDTGDPGIPECVRPTYFTSPWTFCAYRAAKSRGRARE